MSRGPILHVTYVCVDKSGMSIQILPEPRDTFFYKITTLHSVASRNSNASSSLFGKLLCYNLAYGCIFVVSWLEHLQVEQTNALCNDIEGHKIISKCLFCNIFVGVFAFAHNIGRQFGGIDTYWCTLLIHWRLKCLGWVIFAWKSE